MAIAANTARAAASDSSTPRYSRARLCRATSVPCTRIAPQRRTGFGFHTFVEDVRGPLALFLPPDLEHSSGRQQPGGAEHVAAENVAHEVNAEQQPRRPHGQDDRERTGDREVSPAPRQ